MIILGQFALEAVLAGAGAVKLPHDKSVFLDEIRNGSVPVLNSVEPLVLVDVALDNVDLSVKDLMQMFAFVEHGQDPMTVRSCSNYSIS